MTAISGAGLTAYAVTADGSVWGWGQGGDGQLGDQPGWSGSYSTSTPVRGAGVENVTAVSGGQANGYALERDGSAWAGGLGDYGALGNGQGIGTYLYVVDTPVAVHGVVGAVATSCT